MRTTEWSLSCMLSHVLLKAFTSNERQRTLGAFIGLILTVSDQMFLPMGSFIERLLTQGATERPLPSVPFHVKP